jgi:hypothetical protein
MKSYYDRRMEVLHCKGCGEKRLMGTRAIFHQEEYLAIVERFAEQHKRCDAYGNQDRARRALVWQGLVFILETQKKAPATIDKVRRRLHLL